MVIFFHPTRLEFTGCAVALRNAVKSDPSGTLVGPLCRLSLDSYVYEPPETRSQFERIVSTKGVDKIVVGYHVHDIGKSCDAVCVFLRPANLIFTFPNDKDRMKV